MVEAEAKNDKPIDLFSVRSLLFLPASNPRAVAKARESAADLVILDPDRVERGPEIMVRDLPGDGERLIRHAEGIDKVFVNGQLFVDKGAYTDARAGRTV